MKHSNRIFIEGKKYLHIKVDGKRIRYILSPIPKIKKFNRTFKKNNKEIQVSNYNWIAFKLIIEPPIFAEKFIDEFVRKEEALNALLENCGFKELIQ